MNKNYTKATKFERPISAMIRFLILFGDCSWAGIEILVGAGIFYFACEKNIFFWFSLETAGKIYLTNFTNRLFSIILHYITPIIFF